MPAAWGLRCPSLATLTCSPNSVWLSGSAWPSRQAYASGASEWTRATKAVYANDLELPGALSVVGRDTNRAKGAQSRQLEADALDEMLDACGPD